MEGCGSVMGYQKNRGVFTKVFLDFKNSLTKRLSNGLLLFIESKQKEYSRTVHIVWPLDEFKNDKESKFFMYTSINKGNLSTMVD